MPTREELLNIEYDKKQMQFAIDGTLIINRKVLNQDTPIKAIINGKNSWLCPFCLKESKKFTIESHGLVKCPNCGLDMKLKTLLFVKECTNQEYARWVYEYRLSGFFRKIKFENWSKKLKELGIAYEFWNEYNRLKGYDNQQEKEPEIYTSEQLQIIINGLYNKLIQGLNKEQIIKELEENKVYIDYNVFDYCFREAEIRIKNEGVKNGKN